MGSETDSLPKNFVAEIVTQSNIVSDQPGVAQMVDPNLVNAWGLSFSTGGNAWVSDNGTGKSSVYDEDGNLQLTVTIPGSRNAEDPNAPSKPTGQVANPDASAFMGDRFIFVTEDGTIAGWQPGMRSIAQTRIDDSDSGAIYKGVALTRVGDQMRLFTADFHNAKVEAYDSNYRELELEGGFVDGHLPDNYAPFNVYALDGQVYVSYAQQALPDKEDDEAGPGHGIVDLYDTNGRLERRLVSHGHLNSPWGMAVAPRGRLLVGNFGDGRVNVYDLRDIRGNPPARFMGSLGTAPGKPLEIEGLWALVFQQDADENENELYFTAGPDDEAHGLFGRIEAAL